MSEILFVDSVVKQLLGRIRELEAQPIDCLYTHLDVRNCDLATYNGYALMETTARALIGPKNSEGTWNLDCTSSYWKELVLKLLRAERAVGYFHARVISCRQTPFSRSFN